MTDTITPRVRQHRLYPLVLAVPAAICLLLVGLALLGDLWAGTIVGAVAVAHVASATVFGLVAVSQRSNLPLRDRPLLQIELAWVLSWIVGILFFAVVNYLLSVYQEANQTSVERLAISPIYWLLSLPLLAIYAVSSAAIFRWAPN